MKRAAPSSLALACAAIAMVSALGALWACASPPDASRATAVGFVDPAGNLDPDPVQFKQQSVSKFLERRCGTLDCHGRPERPLRIYGERGLRLPNDAGNRPTVGGTSDEEVVANYRAVVGLEPELMSRVVAARGVGTCALEGEPPDVLCPRRLLLISKPLACNTTSSVKCNGTSPGVEHKGGAVIAPNDEGYTCLVSWIEGSANGAACESAANAY